jgi:hypothetical protein
MNTHTTTEELLEAVFSMQPVSSLWNEKIWSWVPMGPETKNCAGEAAIYCSAQKSLGKNKNVVVGPDRAQKQD